jgi:hypothetical protein
MKIRWDWAAMYSRNPRGVEVLYVDIPSVDVTADFGMTAAAVVTAVATSVTVVIIEEAVAGMVNGKGKLLRR